MRKIDLTNFRVATSETARQINRRIALNFIRRHNPMSRADLARRSGLQRSTVSAIVDQLIDEGWVTEGAIGRAPRGRRPRFLHLNVERAGILAVELRPEVTTVGLAGVDARFVEQTSWPTPHSAEAFVRKLARTVAAMQRAHPRVVCEGMGVSLPGRVEMTAAWDRLGPIVLDEVKKRTLPHVTSQIVPTDPSTAAAAPRRGHPGRAATLRRAERRVSL